ncbi:MAG: glycosyltransferase family 2 protein [Tannerellaceae bacterium]|jgi:GT2 family glycosyltransferase|nr:glycosyltransferase family 2 protein [Tannerellaceae bacterium]
MKISVVIVSYNVKYILEQCLLSVHSALSGMEAEVFVVDNNSPDGSADYIRDKFPEVEVIANDHNAGFAVANNQAIRRSSGQYVLLLNPDTVIGEESIRTLCYFMDENPQAGGAGVKMLDGHGVFLPESKRSFPTPWVSFCKMSGLSALFPGSRLFARYRLPYLNPDRQHAVDVLAGAFMLLRREALDKAGLLDEAFFMYGEDIDLSYRLVMSGYRNYYLPERILHYKGESTQRGDISFVRNFYGAMLIFYRKYYPRSGVAVSLLIRLAINLRASAATLARIAGAGRRKAKRVRRRRLLVLCREANFEAVKAAAVERMPELEFVNLWNLDVKRAMDAICRRNQMKAFTDIAFCCRDMRFEQMLLFMDTIVDKKTTYHIYNVGNNRLISPKNNETVRR